MVKFYYGNRPHWTNFWKTQMRVIDAITFGGEVDMLEGRLNTYYNDVDKFVIVEGNQMYANQRKPYLFEENAERFAPFMDKIVYEKIKSLSSDNAWENDWHQRSQLTGIVNKLGLDNDDIVLVLDTDEWYVFDQVKNITQMMSLDMNKMHMSLHWFHKIEKTGIVGKWRELKNVDLNKIRWHRYDFPTLTGGWHLTSMGDLDYLIRKVRGFAHQELVVEGVDAELEDCWTNGRDLYGNVFHEVDLHEAFYPAWIMERKFPEIWYRRRPEGSKYSA